MTLGEEDHGPTLPSPIATEIRITEKEEGLSWKWKAAIVGGILLLLFILIFIIKQQQDALDKLQYAEQSVVEMKQLRDDIVRAQASYASRKDVERIIKDSGVDLGTIEDDLKKLDAEVKGVSTVLSKSQGFRGTDLPSTGTTPRPDKPEPVTVECPDGGTVECPSQDKFGHLSATKYLRLNEPFGEKKVPWGRAGFSAWKEKPWELEVYPREYTVVNVLSTNDDGRHFVHSKFFLRTEGEQYSIPITESKFVEVLPESRFRFSPRLYLSVDAGVKANPPVHGEIVPNLQMSLFSYGRTRVDPDWTFLGIGIGYEAVEDGIGFVVSPINYNIAHHLPFVENLHFGPALGFDPGGNISILLGLRVGL